MNELLDKTAIRTDVLAKRDALPDETVLAFAMRLAERGPQIARSQGAETVSVFSSIGREAATGLMMDALHKAGFGVCLPVTGKIGTPLVFRRWTPQTIMVSGRMGISEPPPEAEVIEPDLLFVPLAAFDRRGQRIGYGAGFYDRTLAALRKEKRVTAVGVAYSIQEVLFVPSADHDEPLDMILTDKELILTADAA